MVVRYTSMCPGCDVATGAHHLKMCTLCECWRSRMPCKVCQHCMNHPETFPFPYTGDMEDSLSAYTKYHGGHGVDDYDLWLRYNGGRLATVTANVNRGIAWDAVMGSPQIAGLAGFHFDLPHLHALSTEDCASAITGRPFLSQLTALQIGRTVTDTSAAINCDADHLAEGRDASGLVALMASCPKLVSATFTIHVSAPNAILAARFPASLEELHLKSGTAFDLSALAANGSAKNLKSLLLGADETAPANLRSQFGALVNSPNLGQVEDLRIAHCLLDDDCCELLIKSPMLKHLRTLWLHGPGTTDRGAKMLAASSQIRGLAELGLTGTSITPQGFEALRQAGVALAQ